MAGTKGTGTSTSKNGPSGTQKWFGGLSLGLMAFMTACGPQQTLLEMNEKDNQGIRNGEAVLASDRVSQSTVALYFIPPGEDRLIPFCTASLVGERSLLTAAHCLAGMSQATLMEVPELLPHLRVGFGLKVSEGVNDSEVQLMTLTKALVHADFSMDSLSDINPTTPIPDMALLQLSKPAPKGFKRVRLLRDADQIVAGLELTLAGYGLTEIKPEPVATTELRKIKVQVLDAKFNPVQFSYQVIEGRAACSGDSGGPAYITDARGQLTLAGVTSFGDRACNSMGVYTSVPAMISWIDNGIDSLEIPDTTDMVASLDVPTRAL